MPTTRALRAEHVATLQRTDIHIPIPAELIEALEATNAVIGDNAETVEVGPIYGRYLVLSAPDLVVAVADARRVLDEIERVVMDARQDALDAERHNCYCGVRLEPGEHTCRSTSCEQEWAMDAAGLIP